MILVKYGEIILKGLNRPLFEQRLLNNIRRTLAGFDIEVSIRQATVYIQQKNPEHTGKIVERLKKVPGIVYIIPVFQTEKDMDKIKQACLEHLAPLLNSAKTFKVESKRSDKKFPLNSPQICDEVGGYILEKFPHLTVDVNKPNKTVHIEVRDFGAYLYCEKIKGIGGMPTGSNGRVCLLLSGGIDSPVAGYMMAKRGVEIECVHFHSPPYSSQQSKEKVLDLCAVLSIYTGAIRLNIVPFTDIQLEIRSKCPLGELTIIMRRFMMKIARHIAVQSGCGALVTGESLGQVASQTLESMIVTNEDIDLPIFRPLIGMDKDEIVAVARDVDTFDISIRPYEDCCTVFVPKHPDTKPRLAKILRSEKALDVERLIFGALENTERIKFSAGLCKREVVL